jgi:hypothetical protein
MTVLAGLTACYGRPVLGWPLCEAWSARAGARRRGRAHGPMRSRTRPAAARVLALAAPGCQRRSCRPRSACAASALRAARVSSSCALPGRATAQRALTPGAELCGLPPPASTRRWGATSWRSGQGGGHAEWQPAGPRRAGVGWLRGARVRRLGDFPQGRRRPYLLDGADLAGYRKLATLTRFLAGTGRSNIEQSGAKHEIPQPSAVSGMIEAEQAMHRPSLHLREPQGSQPAPGHRPLESRRAGLAAGRLTTGGCHHPVTGRSGRSHPALAMHKHTAWPPACSAVAGIANGVESS